MRVPAGGEGKDKAMRCTMEETKVASDSSGKTHHNHDDKVTASGNVGAIPNKKTDFHITE